MKLIILAVSANTPYAFPGQNRPRQLVNIDIILVFWLLTRPISFIKTLLTLHVALNMFSREFLREMLFLSFFMLVLTVSCQQFTIKNTGDNFDGNAKFSDWGNSCSGRMHYPQEENGWSKSMILFSCIDITVNNAEMFYNWNLNICLKKISFSHWLGICVWKVPNLLELAKYLSCLGESGTKGNRWEL